MSLKPVLVLNFGSSSLKFAIINVNDGKKHIYGSAECLGTSKSKIICRFFKKLEKKEILRKYRLNNATHKEALDIIVNSISKEKPGLFSKLIAIGHRVVHGGERFTQSTIIDNNIIQGIKNAIPFAPLHNPAHLIGIYESFKRFPNLIEKNVAVFDTAFHQTMPETSYLYALPYFLYKKYSIRRYGAHGISHQYITNETSKILKKPIQKINIITCHLGNGSSLAAIRNGKCVDTSMGFTPLEGLVMGTRCGDIDPSIIFYLYNSLNMSMQDINYLLSQRSGLLGITGNVSDCRDIEKEYNSKKSARLAIDIYCHRLAKYIGAYSTLMGDRLDAITFTGGIGENSSLIRLLTLKKLSLLNIKIDIQKNSYLCFGETKKISVENSIPVFVIPTNEELIIAKDAEKIINEIKK